jgi:nucleoside-diphosphate-sugar epimerase
MRILVIGGTGFVGPHVVRRLVAAGHAVTLFHRGRTEVQLPTSVTHLHGDRERLGDHRIAFARTAPEVVLDMRPMTGGEARAVMDVCRGITGRIVALSSGDVYRAYDIFRGREPGPPEAIPLTEEARLRERLYPYRGQTPRNADDPLRWVDEYDKILVERAVLGDASFPGTVLRLPMVYGPGDAQHRLGPYLRRMDDGRRAILLNEARAPWRWTRGYVEDVADAVALAATDARAGGRIYNVGEPDALTEAQWVGAVGRAAGWRGDVVALRRDCLPGPHEDLHFDQHLVMDTTRIRTELGYLEHLTREDGLQRTVAWERAHPPERREPLAALYAAEDAALARSGGNSAAAPL